MVKYFLMNKYAFALLMVKDIFNRGLIISPKRGKFEKRLPSTFTL